LTVTDDGGLNGTYTQIVEVVDPAILRVYLPEGIYVKQNTGDPWIDEGWLLNRTGDSWSFTLKIYDTSKCLTSYDTHLIVALNDAAYNNLQSLSINGTSIPKSAFKNGKPKPYGKAYWPNCVYPTWFNDTYINVGTIPPKGSVTLTVSVTFSNATGARMHFDAYGSVVNRTPCSWAEVTWSPNSEDSTVLYQAAPLPLSVSITPTSAVIDLGQYVTFNSIVSGGTTPYSYQWYLDGSAVNGANQSSWIFTPSATGYYLVHLNVTDKVGNEAKSNVAQVTVNPPLSVEISPTSASIKLGESVPFSSIASGGTLPYTYQWYVNETAVPGANTSSWTFTPSSIGYYVIFLKVTDNASSTTVSNNAYVTVSLPEFQLVVRTIGLGAYVTNIYNGSTVLGTATDATPYVGLFAEGSIILLNIDSPITNGSKRFVFTQWTGDASGTIRPVTVIIDSAKDITANYKTQYQITVTATPSGALGGTFKVTYTQCGTTYTNVEKTTPWTDWADAGTTVTVSEPQDIIDVSLGTRYKFDYYSPSSSVTMDNTKTITLVYKIQYYLTVKTNPAEVLTLNPAAVSGEGWYDGGSTATVDAVQNVDKVAGQSRYDFRSWTGATPTGVGNQATVYMDGPKTATANYKLQYKFTVGTNGLGIKVTNVYNGTTILGTATDGTPFSGWFDENALIQLDIDSPIYGSPIRYVFTHWTGDASGSNRPVSLTLNSQKSITANYKTQFEITFSQSGVGSDFTGTVLIVDDVGYGVSTLPVSFWWDMNSVHNFAFQSPLVVSANAKQYVWTSTSGLSTLQSGSLTVSTFGSVTGNYKTQFYLTVSSPYGSPSPTSGWFDSGTPITASVTSPWAGPTGTRYVCTGWSGTGSVPSTGTTTSVSFTINQPSSITWNWKTQYLLTVVTDPAGLSPQPSRNPVGEAGPANGWWYDATTSVTLTAQTVSGYTFTYWDVNGISQGSGVNPITVNMNGPYTATAHYTTAAPPLSVSITPMSASIILGQSVQFTSSVTGGTQPYKYQWYLGGVPVSGANGTGWTFTPTATGVYYVYLNVTDANNNTATSGTAKIVVSSIPVGGYAISLAKGVSALTFQTAIYTALVILFGLMLSLTKRKRK
jgi:hypothetical protein